MTSALHHILHLQNKITMTVSGLWENFICRDRYDLVRCEYSESSSNKKKRKQKFRPNNPVNCLSGKKLAVDASIYIIRGLLTTESARQFHMEPSIPVTGVTRYIRKFVNSLRAEDIEVVMVFDGQQNNLKSATNDERQKI